ncbi:hypothetical protein MIND_00895700 [Mycena indigotica]|uniref:F-box domain-containing protein n=1 Tax=Mycena indigotica TaxID=2126181 RepID=A0A8H6SH39_9AGAR|nr:uncharacterized protein MIND_00895700 [Mycena indigotica]KAF7299458.1 hypothetical protein MIND_00895700 [Mycena indigotica]
MEDSTMNDFYTILAESAAPGFERQARSLLVEEEAKLARIESQLKMLLWTRDRQRARIAALKYVVSPVRMLPADVLLVIFKQAFWLGLGSFEPPSRLVLRLASVCAYWRQLVISSPRLWAWAMKLNVSNISPWYTEVTKTVFQRSSPHPLSITMTCRDHKKPVSATVVKTVLSFAHRWSRINVNFDLTPFLNAAPRPTLLEHLTFAKLALSQGAKGKESDIFLHAPKLFDLSISIGRLAKLPLPWSQLTKLELTTYRPFTSSEFLATIEQCTSVSDLQVDSDGWEQGDDISIPPHFVSLPRLRNLNLRMSGNLDPFFAHFTFPALSKLDVYLDWSVSFENSLRGPFSAFLGRCTALEELEIFGSEMNSETLDDILLNIPSVVDLQLICCFACVDNAFFERLTYREMDANPPAPRLEAINLENVGDCYDEDVVVAMVRSRWWKDEVYNALPTPPGVARWKNISISANDTDGAELSDEFKAVMQDICAEGLNFDVYTYTRPSG